MGKALRDVYGETLREYAERDKRIIAMDADLANCSKACKLEPGLEGQHYNVGIAEANMIAMAAGFASCGYIPFVNTFATVASSICMIATKAMIAYSGLEVRIVGANTGLCGGYDGATHHSFDDVNAMRAIPGMTILVPSDEHMVRWAVGALTKPLKGPAYMGISRNETETLYTPETPFEIGRAKKLRDGKDATIIACGMATARAMKAAEALEKEGISAAVVDMFTIKPLDREAVIAAAADTGAIITAEEHSIIGGLGTAVLEVIAEEQLRVPCGRVGIRDCYTQSGSYKELVERYAVGSDAIAEAVKRTAGKKRG